MVPRIRETQYEDNKLKRVEPDIKIPQPTVQKHVVQACEPETKILTDYTSL